MVVVFLLCRWFQDQQCEEEREGVCECESEREEASAHDTKYRQVR